MQLKSSYLYFAISIIMLNDSITPAIAKTKYLTALSCKMVSGRKVNFEVSDDLALYNDGTFTIGPFMNLNGKKKAIFDKGITYDLIKGIYLTRCVKHVAIFVIGYSSYMVGTAIRENPVTHKYERIDFSEHELPHWLYLRNKKWKIIIPGNKYSTDSNFFIYTYTLRKKQPEQRSPMDYNPVPKGQLITIPQPKNNNK